MNGMCIIHVIEHSWQDSRDYRVGARSALKGVNIFLECISSFSSEWSLLCIVLNCFYFFHMGNGPWVKSCAAAWKGPRGHVMWAVMCIFTMTWAVDVHSIFSRKTTNRNWKENCILIRTQSACLGYLSELYSVCNWIAQVWHDGGDECGSRWWAKSYVSSQQCVAENECILCNPHIVLWNKHRCADEKKTPQCQTNQLVTIFIYMLQTSMWAWSTSCVKCVLMPKSFPFSMKQLCAAYGLCSLLQTHPSVKLEGLDNDVTGSTIAGLACSLAMCYVHQTKEKQRQCSERHTPCPAQYLGWK